MEFWLDEESDVASAVWFFVPPVVSMVVNPALGIDEFVWLDDGVTEELDEVKDVLLPTTLWLAVVVGREGAKDTKEGVSKVVAEVMEEGDSSDV